MRSELFDRGDCPLEGLHTELAGCIAPDLDALLSGAVIGVVKRHDPTKPWKPLLQKLQALRRQVREPTVDTKSWHQNEIGEPAVAELPDLIGRLKPWTR
jgi:hypothetical protein